MNTSVSCAGIIVADTITSQISGFPKKGEMSMAARIELQVGGCAANTARILARLGVTPHLYAKLGNDNLGKAVLGILRDEGINTSCIVVSKESNTGCSIVLTSTDGDRSFITSLGANESFNADDLDWAIIRKTGHLHIGGTLLLPMFDGVPTYSAFLRAHEYGLTTSLDTVWDASGKWMDAIYPCLPQTDIFFAGIAEAQHITGIDEPKAIADVLIGHGVKTVVVKQGKLGSSVYTKDEECIAPIFDVDTVNTNGAGDAYVGGFITGFLEKLPLKLNTAFATVVGGMSTTTSSPLGSIADYKTTLALAVSFSETF